MKKYQVKKGHKVLTKKRGMVTDYITFADIGDEKLIKMLLDDEIIIDQTTSKSSYTSKKDDSQKVKNES